MRVTRVGLSMFTFEVAPGRTALTDPWITGNPTAVKSFLAPESLAKVDAMLVSHGHLDHATGILDVQKCNPDAQVYCPYELAFLLLSEGVRNVHPINVGGSSAWGDANVTLVPAVHSSSYGPGRSYAGAACGVILTLANGFRAYYAGDTSLTAEMRMIGEYYKPDLALLPCGGVLTMDVDQAVYAAGELLKVPHVIPCHYFPTVQGAADPDGMAAFVKRLPFIAELMDHGTEFRDEMGKRYPDVTVTVLECGDSTELDAHTSAPVKPHETPGSRN